MSHVRTLHFSDEQLRRLHQFLGTDWKENISRYEIANILLLVCIEKTGGNPEAVTSMRLRALSDLIVRKQDNSSRDFELAGVIMAIADKISTDDEILAEEIICWLDVKIQARRNLLQQSRS